MNDDYHGGPMRVEIEKRMASKDWSGRIAKAVIRRKREQRNKMTRAAFASTLASAALLIVVFHFGINRDPAPVTYGQFITIQVRGTYQSVFTGVPAVNGTLPEYDELLRTGGIDSTINDALMNR